MQTKMILVSARKVQAPTHTHTHGRVAHTETLYS